LARYVFKSGGGEVISPSDAEVPKWKKVVGPVIAVRLYDAANKFIGHIPSLLIALLFIEIIYGWANINFAIAPHPSPLPQAGGEGGEREPRGNPFNPFV
jgi:hypothetical protein